MGSGGSRTNVTIWVWSAPICLWPVKITRQFEDRAFRRDVDADEFRAAAFRFFDLLEGAAELVFVHPGHLSHGVSSHSYLSFITFCVENGISMEKVVISLGGSVLVPGEEDAKYLRDLASLWRYLSSPVADASRATTSRPGGPSESANALSTNSASRSRA